MAKRKAVDPESLYRSDKLGKEIFDLLVPKKLDLKLKLRSLKVAEKLLKTMR